MANDASAPISSRSTKELTSDSEIRFPFESGNGISAGDTGSNDPLHNDYTNTYFLSLPK